MASRNSLNKLVNARKGQEPMEYGKDRQESSSMSAKKSASGSFDTSYTPFLTTSLQMRPQECATTEPQQKASAGDNNFSDDCYLSDEFEGDSAKISTFFMSPSPFDAGEDDEDEKTEQNVDSAITEPQQKASGNKSASKDKADKKSMSNKGIKKVVTSKKAVKSPSKAPRPTLTMKKNMKFPLDLDCIERERFEGDEKQYKLQLHVWVNASKFSKQFPERYKRYNEQKAMGKKTAALDSDVSKVFKVSDSDRDRRANLTNISGKKSRTESAPKKKLTGTKLVKPESSGTHSSRKAASKKVSNKQKEAEYKVDENLGVRWIRTGEDEYPIHREGKSYALKPSKPMPLMPPKPKPLSSTADDDEQSDEDPQKEEDEDDGHNETAEIDESGKDGDTGKSKLSTKRKRAANTRKRAGGRFAPTRTNDGFDEKGDEVEKVLKRRVRPTLGLVQKEAWEYLIKWKGRDKPTWETDVNVEHLKVVQKYIAQLDAKGKPVKSRKRVHTSTNNDVEDSTSSQDTRRSPRLSKRKRVTRQLPRLVKRKR